MEETLQTVNHQSTRLKSDLRVSQQERDSLKHEVALLHKQLQNAVDKVRFLFLYSKVKDKLRAEQTDLLPLLISEPYFGDGPALKRSAESQQEAVQRWDVSADGAGAAATEARKRETSSRSVQHQRRPHPVQRKSELSTTEKWQAFKSCCFLFFSSFFFSVMWVFFSVFAGPSAWCYHTLPEAAQTSESVLSDEGLGTGKLLS